MLINPGLLRGSSYNLKLERIIPCALTISTPVDATITVPVDTPYCSSGAIEVDSVAVGSGIVVINGVWRLT